MDNVIITKWPVCSVLINRMSWRRFSSISKRKRHNTIQKLEKSKQVLGNWRINEWKTKYFQTTHCLKLHLLPSNWIESKQINSKYIFFFHFCPLLLTRAVITLVFLKIFRFIVFHLGNFIVFVLCCVVCYVSSSLEIIRLFRLTYSGVQRFHTRFTRT